MATKRINSPRSNPKWEEEKNAKLEGYIVIKSWRYGFYPIWVKISTFPIKHPERKQGEYIVTVHDPYFKDHKITKTLVDAHEQAKLYMNNIEKENR